MQTSNLAGVKVGPGQPVRIMGVINVSPESFYKSSVGTKAHELRRLAHQMEANGADFIDVGAMSTAPYLTTQISESEEARRLAWAVPLIRRSCRLPISIDSMRSVPALAGLQAGGKIINDVSGFHADPRMAFIARKAKGVILMAHPTGLKGRRAARPVADTTRLLRQSLSIATTVGISKTRIVVDPGIGFFRGAKIDWWRWDVEILLNLKKFQTLGVPLLIGVSRKSFIGKILGGKPANERLAGSLAATVVAVLNGASLVRTHDVRETREAVRIAEQLRG